MPTKVASTVGLGPQAPRRLFRQGPSRQPAHCRYLATQGTRQRKTSANSDRASSQHRLPILVQHPVRPHGEAVRLRCQGVAQ